MSEYLRRGAAAAPSLRAEARGANGNSSIDRRRPPPRRRGPHLSNPLSRMSELYPTALKRRCLARHTVPVPGVTASAHGQSGSAAAGVHPAKRRHRSPRAFILLDIASCHHSQSFSLGNAGTLYLHSPTCSAALDSPAIVIGQSAATWLRHTLLVSLKGHPHLRHAFERTAA